MLLFCKSREKHIHHLIAEIKLKNLISKGSEELHAAAESGRSLTYLS